MRKRLFFAVIIAILGVNYCHSVVYDLNSDDSITDVSSATFTDALGLADMLEPTTPPADTGYFWLKSDGAIHFKNDAGTDFDLTTGGAIGVSSIRKAGDALLTGAVTLTGGSNITLTQVGNDISFAAAGGGVSDHDNLTSTGTVTHTGLETSIGLNTTHRGSDGSDHSLVVALGISTGTLQASLDAVILSTGTNAANIATNASDIAALEISTGTLLSKSSATLTYINKLAEFVGDVTGTFDATVVGDDSHSHSTFTLIGFDQLLGTTDSPTFVNVIATATYAQNSDLLDGLDSTYFLPITVHNGAFFEEFHATVSVVGATIMMNIEKQNTGDLTMHFDGSITTFDTTPSSAIALTPGSDTSPQANYVYITSTTKYMEVSTSNWPTGEHIKIGYFYCQSTQTTSDAGGILINQNWNSGLKNADDNIGELLHITERLRRMGAVYFSGIAGNGTEGYLSPSVGITSFTTTAGIVYQLHSQVFPAFDTNIGDELHVKNWFGDSFHTLTNLFDITADSGGNTITNNKFFNLTFWGVQNKSDEHQTVIINLPSGFYNSQASAEEDVSGYDDFTIPREFNLESSTGFLIARVTIQMGATWTIASTTDLRGTTPQTASGGAAGTVTMFADNTFDIFDNLDDSKIIVFDAGANITTGNTRTITMANADVDLTDVGLNNTHRASGGSDHASVLLTDGSRALAGAWDMDDQSVTNINIDSGRITGIVDLAVPDGGTGTGSFTDHGVLLGSGSGTFSVTGTGSSGEVLTSNGASADPTFQAASGNFLSNVSSDTMLTNLPVGNALTIHNTAADVTGNSWLLDLVYTDNGDVNAHYIKCSDDSGGTPTIFFRVDYRGKVTALDDIQADSFIFDSDTSNAEIGWTSSGNDHAFLAVETNGVTRSGNFYFLARDNKTNTYGHPTTIDPKFFIMSGRGATASTTDYMVLYHDRSDARINVGTGGDLKINTNIISTGTVTATSGIFSAQTKSNSRNLVDQYPFLVTISTPSAASTTIGYAVSGIIPYAFTITTMTAFVNGGTNWVVNLEYRDPSTLSTDGTEIWTSDVTGTTSRIGGTFAAAGAVPAGKILYVDITSASGFPAQGCIEGLILKDSP